MAADFPPFEEGETIAPSRIARPAVIALLIAAGFAVRTQLESDPGPMFLAPILLAAWWYGRVGGFVVGLASTLAFIVARDNNPATMGGSAVAAAGYRVGADRPAGHAFAWGGEDRGRLRAEVHAGRRNMAELRDLQEALAPPEVPVRP